MNRSLRSGKPWIVATTLTALALAGMGGCASFHDSYHSFDVGTSEAPQSQVTPQAPAKGTMLVASDTLGGQVFKDRATDNAFASVPSE